MNKQQSKYDIAIKLLKELNCPDAIMAELYMWGIVVLADEVTLNKWEALSMGTSEGEFRIIENKELNEL